ncbi:ATP-binding protein [Lysobacter terrae]
MRVDTRDLARFAGIGLLLCPLGLTAIGAASKFRAYPGDEIATAAVEVLFAKHFGVAIITFPLVMAWCEKSAPKRERLSTREWLWPVLLCVSVIGSLAASKRIHEALSAPGNGGIVLMDYRFILFVLLGWCVWRLRPRWSMPLLSLSLFGMVFAMSSAATQNGTPLGFLNLAHLAIELSVLLMAMLYFLVFERERRELAFAQAKERADRAREALERSRLDLALALESGQLGIWHSEVRSRTLITDQLDVEIDVDANARRIWGLPSDQRITRRAYLEILHPEDRDRALARMMEALAHDDGSYSDTYRIRRGGEVRVVAVRGALVARRGASTDEELRFTGIVRDITDEENLKADLRQKAHEAQMATESKARFLAMMSHEIRTPMNGIVGMIELLADTLMGPTQQRMLKSCKDSAFALLTILNDILDFSKIEAGKIDLEHASVSLRRVVEGVAETLGTYASQQGIDLNAHVAPEVPRCVMSDEVRLRQILTNLVGNAIKFTERGSVTVSVGLEEHDLEGRAVIRFDVVDTGIGMSAETVQALFQPFHQADAATTRRFGGTGLGLSIVKQLAELMGGTVECESKPSQGSRFSVVIPMQVVPVGEHDRIESMAAEPGGASARIPATVTAEVGEVSQSPVREGEEAAQRLILLAEDNAVNREVISLQLARLGYACDMAEDGEQAWTMLQSGISRYALLLTDGHMPRLDGYELTRRIRDYEHSVGAPPIPIVAITASALQGEGERCLEAGMSAYLTKPLQMQELQRCLARFLPEAVSS